MNNFLSWVGKRTHESEWILLLVVISAMIVGTSIVTLIVLFPKYLWWIVFIPPVWLVILYLKERNE